MKTSYIQNTAIALTITGLSALSLLPQKAAAIEPEQISVRAGTLGIGGEYAVEIIPTIVVRAVAQGYNMNYDNTVDGIKYDGKLKLGSAGLQADFHPPLIPLYVTGGVYYNNNSFEMDAVSAASYNIGGTNYTGAQIGTLKTKAEFDKTALYGGLGLEFQIGPIAAVAEGGIFYQGEPDIQARVTGPIANDQTFQSNLDNEMAKVKDKYKDARYWPALTIAARWKF